MRGASPEVLEPWVAKYVNDLRNGKRDPARDLQALGESCRTPKTARGYQSAIRALLAMENIPLPGGGRRYSGRSGLPPRPVTREEILTPGKILKILEHLDTRGRAILYVLASSGARPGEVLAIRLEDLDLVSRPARFMVRDRNTGASRVAFISREAVGAVQVYLMVRDRYLESARARGGMADGHLLFPLGTRAFGQIWALALSKARLERFDGVTSRRTLTPHATRRFFATRMKEVIPAPLVDEMMGQARYSPEPHHPGAGEDLARAYLAGEKALLLHRSHARERIDKRLADLEKVVEGLRTDLKGRDEEIDELRRILHPPGKREGIPD